MSSPLPLLKDWQLASAVSHIVHRSERQSDLGLLADTFVDTGILRQLDNANNEVFYGRRGTGKSHLLRILASHARQRPNATCVYVDLRTLGSAQLMTDLTQPLASRSVAVFRDLLGEIQQRLLDYATDPARDASATGFEQVSAFADAIRAVSSVVSQKQITIERSTLSKQDRTLRLNVGTAAANLEIGGSSGHAAEAHTEEQYQQIFSDDIVFGEVAQLATDTLQELKIDHLLLLLDEWTAMPADLQPYVAEFLKRTFLTNPRVTLKVAALEYRSTFSVPLETNNAIGFELGGDLSARLDLDAFYTSNQGYEPAIDSFASMLYRHINTGLTPGYLAQEHAISSARDFQLRMFDGPEAFQELVTAGVVRDFLQIFTAAFFRALRHGNVRVDSVCIRAGARDYFEMDKMPNLSLSQEAALDQVSTYLIGEHHTQFFAVERRHARDPMLQSLFDRRVIHLAIRSHSIVERPGVRFSVYCLDYALFAESSPPLPNRTLATTASYPQPLTPEASTSAFPGIVILEPSDFGPLDHRAK